MWLLIQSNPEHNALFSQLFQPRVRARGGQLFKRWRWNSLQGFFHVSWPEHTASDVCVTASEMRADSRRKTCGPRGPHYFQPGCCPRKSMDINSLCTSKQKKAGQRRKGVCTVELSDVEGEKCAFTRPSKNPDRFQGGFWLPWQVISR